MSDNVKDEGNEKENKWCWERNKAQVVGEEQ